MKVSDVKNSVLLLKGFIGQRVLLIGLVSILSSIGLFLVEIAFAYCIQGFLASLGLATFVPPSWPLNFSSNIFLKYVLLTLIFVGTLRGLFILGLNYSAAISTLYFENINRKRVVSWAFGNRSSRLSEVTSLFNDNAIGAANFVSSLIGSVSRIIVATLLLLALFRLSFSLTCVAVLSLFILVFPFRFIGRLISTVSNSLHQEIDSSIDRLLRGVKNSLFLTIYGINFSERQKTLKCLDRYEIGYKKYHFLSGLKSTIPPVFGIYIICAIAHLSSIEGILSGGLLIQYFYLFIRFVQSLGELANLSSYLNLTKPRFILMYKWWIKSRRVKVAKEPILERNNKVSFYKPLGFVVDNLSYAYDGKVGKVLDGINFNINPGETLVVTGESGSGKTTLIYLMLGLLECKKGAVKIFHEGFCLPIEECKDLLLQSLGYVGPDSFMVPGNIRDNLLYGNSLTEISEKEILDAIKLTGCGFVWELDGQLDHQLTEQGEGLSAGQKQRLALARALLRKPKVLILDEATSNLDSITESLLIDTLASLKPNITIIAVTHREGLLRIADKHLAMTN